MADGLLALVDAALSGSFALPEEPSLGPDGLTSDDSSSADPLVEALATGRDFMSTAPGGLDAGASAAAAAAAAAQPASRRFVVGRRQGRRPAQDPEASANTHAKTPGPNFGEFARLGGAEYVDASGNEYRFAREGPYWATLVDSREIDNDGFDIPPIHRAHALGTILFWTRLHEGELSPEIGASIQLYHINTQVLVTGKVETSFFYDKYRTGTMTLSSTTSHGAIADPAPYEVWVTRARRVTTRTP